MSFSVNPLRSKLNHRRNCLELLGNLIGCRREAAEGANVPDPPQLRGNQIAIPPDVIGVVRMPLVNIIDEEGAVDRLNLDDQATTPRAARNSTCPEVSAAGSAESSAKRSRSRSIFSS